MTGHTTNVHAKILAVDDDQGAREVLREALATQSYEVITARDGLEALQRCDELLPDLLLVDLAMPRMNGLALIQELRRRKLDVPAIVVTSASDVRSAVDAMRAGATNYLLKPIDVDELLLTVDRELQHQGVVSENAYLRRQRRCEQSQGLQGLIGRSDAMQELYRLVRQVAPSTATALIAGESGTGKGEVARVIHSLSDRAKGPFVTVHCAALAESVLESELFGHERGAFTGAERRRIGRFEQAHDGTLFLDEIGEISAAVQVKLLNVLQERSVQRVGGNATVPTNVRLIAATNRDLKRHVEAGRFREDLYYRLNVVRIDVPPLRHRDGDVPLLAHAFLARIAQENHKVIHGFSPEARAKLESSDWPGNVRELQNTVEHAVVLCEGSQIEVQHLPDRAPTCATGPVSGVDIPGASMEDVERYAILKTLEATDGSTVRAAEILQMSVRTIQYRLRAYGLAKARGRPPSEPPTAPKRR